MPLSVLSLDPDDLTYRSRHATDRPHLYHFSDFRHLRGSGPATGAWRGLSCAADFRVLDDDHRLEPYNSQCVVSRSLIRPPVAQLPRVSRARF